MNRCIVLLVIVYFIALLSCGAPSDDNQNNTSPPQLAVAYKSIVYTQYNLPLPVDLYLFLRQNRSIFDSTLLHAPDKSKSYTTEVTKAINLGFYSSDLAYCAVFESNRKAVQYMEVTKQLANELSIDKGYNESIIQRGYQNINNSDSLQDIATKAYWEACNYLESNKKVNILPFIIVGSWIESVYLAANSYTPAISEVELRTKLTEQNESLNNLLKYLVDVMADSNAFELNREIQVLINQLTALKVVYEKYDPKSKQLISEEQLNAILKKIESLRVYYQ